MDEIVDPKTLSAPVNHIPENKIKKTFRLFKDSWKSFSKKQKFQLIAVFALVLGLPTILGGVYAVKLYRSAAATPPVVPSSNPAVTQPQNIIVPGPYPYMVGVDYHATSLDIETSSFIGAYDKPAVRATVRAQLQSMVNSGAQIISTRIWMSDPPGQQYPDTPFRLHFPLSQQELKNLRQYVQDVAMIKSPSGAYVDLYLGIENLRCANPSTYMNFPNCNQSWSYLVNTTKQTYNNFFTAIGDITRPDGVKAVRLVYANGEVMIPGAKPNLDIWMKELYPYFVAKAQSYGITPSLYFTSLKNESDILNNNYKDAKYPILNNHKSLYWLYRTTKWMQDNNLPLPARLDFSFYVHPVATDDATLVKRVFDDLQAVYPKTPVGIAETQYIPNNPVELLKLGQAFVQENLKRGMPQVLTFWTTGQWGAFPFNFSAWYLPNLPGSAPGLPPSTPTH